MSKRHLLIGAHLLEEDARVDGITLFPAGGVVLSAFDFEGDIGLGSRAVVARAAGLRAELIAREVFVAIRYGASVYGPEEAAAKTAHLTARWRDLLARYRGHVELTLKVLATESSPRPDRRQFSSGAAYLRALARTGESKSIDSRFRQEVERLFGEEAAAAKWVPRQEAALEYAFLVPRGSIEGVRSRGLTLKENFPEIPFLLSGPWPLEVFADD